MAIERVPGPLAFLPSPRLLGARLGGKGAYFPNPKIGHQVFGLRRSKHCHSQNILVDYKDRRTGQEILTWTVTISLNDSRRSEVDTLSSGILKSSWAPQGLRACS